MHTMPGFDSEFKNKWIWKLVDKNYEHHEFTNYSDNQK